MSDIPKNKSAEFYLLTIAEILDCIHDEMIEIKESSANISYLLEGYVFPNAESEVSTDEGEV